LFSNNEFLKEKTSDPCIICFEDLKNIVVTPCRHIFCLDCTKHMSNDLKSHFNCPECRAQIACNTLNITTVDIINKGKQDLKSKEGVVSAGEDGGSDVSGSSTLTPLEQKLGADWKNICINKYGSKMALLVEYLYKIFENKENRVIIFSQYDKMLQLISITLTEFKIKFVYCTGNNYVLNRNINKFKTDDSYRVIMLSSQSSNSGTTLTEANHVVMCDVLYDNIEKVKAMESQIIGRAVRLGQKLPVKLVRFVTKGTVEEEHFNKNRYDINILQN
jgi:SNF2 family DNA or RNA helicase